MTATVPGVPSRWPAGPWRWRVLREAAVQQTSQPRVILNQAPGTCLKYLRRAPRGSVSAQTRQQVKRRRWSCWLLLAAAAAVRRRDTCRGARAAEDKENIAPRTFGQGLPGAEDAGRGGGGVRDDASTRFLPREDRVSNSVKKSNLGKIKIAGEVSNAGEISSPSPLDCRTLEGCPLPCECTCARDRRSGNGPFPSPGCLHPPLFRFSRL